MAQLTFRKSIKIAPGVRVNVTHRGVRSVSAGAGGLRLTQQVGSRGSNRRAPSRPARPAKPTLREREAARIAALPADQQAAAKRQQQVTLAWVAAVVGLLFAPVIPLSLLIAIPALIVAITMTVNGRKARRAVRP